MTLSLSAMISVLRQAAEGKEPNDSLCCKCQQEAATEAHMCPFSEEIYDDLETKCNCCDDCRQQCAYDI